MIMAAGPRGGGGKGRGKERGKGSGKGGGSGTPAIRGGAARLKTARGRRLSSALWLQRQLNDPFVLAARREGLRSRAAYKLMQIDDKFGFLRPGARVLDLGAAPGGWSQVAVRRVRAGQQGGGSVVGIDLQEMEPMPGASFLVVDMHDGDAPARIREVLGGAADVVLSDMAAPSTGHPATDHLRIMALLELACDLAVSVLAEGGTFVGKVLRGGAERALLDRFRHHFAKVRHVKPPASRQDSAEIYIVATGFRTRAET